MPTELSWEDLRVDVTFHGHGAEPAPLIDEVWRRCRAIPGWFTVDDCAHFQLVLGLLAQFGVAGDLLEIGTYHGRSAALLAHFLGRGERLFVCDTFQTEPTGYPDPPTPEVLLSHLARVNPGLDRAQIVIHAGNSRTLELGEARLRFAHVDGDHSGDGCYHDLCQVAEHLVPGGVLVIDDYHNPRYPEVTGAADRFLAERRAFSIFGDVNRHGAMGRKLYLSRRPEE